MKKRRRQRRYSYTIMLAASLVVAASVWISDSVRAEENKMVLWARSSETGESRWSEMDGPQDSSGSEETEEIREEGKGGGQERQVLAAAVKAADILPGECERETPGLSEEPGAETEKTQPPVMYQADTSYFGDALFIGDSRTVGLYEYGDLGEAEVVADSGMNVYKIFDKKFATRSGEKKTLETILSERVFGKIYLMLGINELGYDYEATVSKYEALVERIREAQPEALIFLQANLHVTEEKSNGSDVYNNENINRFNQAVEQMADGRQLFYLDVNELFDDEKGNLSKEYTVDNAHVLGRYYADWVDWILSQAR